MPLKIEDLVFVDFEASSLEEDSWPVEVGMAWIEGNTVQSWSSLICPAPDWSMNAWSAVSAEIHGIPLSELHGAPSAWEVAQEFLSRISGKTLVSDAPAFESRWATRLVHAAVDSPKVQFSDYDAAAAHFFDGMALDCLYERLERLHAPHRAGIDAERLAKGFLRGLEIQSPCPE
ncbi:hypothetical protein [Pseudosulfitobacter pseudonitzschiae]|uniref:3'-5' exonuclease n=1 Tax=Pseudosulfitobacter pseudonitzschiae TaxID=1402135 RepID=UPI003B76B861